MDDGGRTFWHSGTLEGSTSVVAHDSGVGLTWAALINCRLEPNNDLWDFMRYAVRRVFTRVPLSTTPLPQQPTLSSTSVAADGEMDSWLEQHDSSISDHNEAVIPPPNVHVKQLANNDSKLWTVRPLVDSLSADTQTAVKLMVQSYQVSDVVSTVADAGYRPTWLDAVNYRGRIFFNVIWTLSLIHI